MARHRSHRRSYGDPLISMPSFGKFDVKALNPMGKSVRFNDVALGAGIGIAGGAAVKYLLNMVWPVASRPAFFQTYLQPITTLMAGAAYMFVSKNKDRARGVFAGAAVTAITPIVFDTLRTQFPTYFGDPYVRMPSYSGLLTSSPQPGQGMYAGLLTASPQPGMSMYSGLEDPVAAFVEQ